MLSPNNIEFKNFTKEFEYIASSKILEYFQLRLKNASDEKIFNLIHYIFPLCKKNKIKFIINDRPEIAKKFNLDGVHVGKNDPSISRCRRLLGKKKIIGKSCYTSFYLANNAQTFGANYIAFGSFFNTVTKENTNKVFIPSIKAWNKMKKISTTGIGGINYRNLYKIRNLDLDFIALSSSIWQSKLKPALALKKIKNVIDKY